MRRAWLLAAWSAWLSACSTPIDVISNADSGEGTLRAALDSAAAGTRGRRIRLRQGLEPIRLSTPLVFAGVGPLKIQGNGTVIDAAALSDTALSATNGALVFSGGGNLALEDLVVRGAAGSGIVVTIPLDHAGRTGVLLDRVTAEANGHHGVLVNDLAGYFADPFTSDSAGSAAGVTIRATNCRFVGNGRRGLDYDGLRVNEGGRGSLVAVIAGTNAEANGGDGIELDERGDGDAAITIEQTRALANGFYSTDDLDDGIDVDEYGPGQLRARLVDVTASLNAQKGVDLTEDGEGELTVTEERVTTEGNPDD